MRFPICHGASMRGFRLHLRIRFQMPLDDVIDRVVANLNRVIRLPHVRRTVAWRGYERMYKSLVDGFIYVGDQIISCNGVEQLLFNVRSGAIQFVNERRANVKRVLFAAPEAPCVL